MGILADMEETLKRGDKEAELLHKLLRQREELFTDVLNCASANIVVTKHSISQLLKETLNTSCGECLSKYKDRECISLDCKNLTKEDAFGWMVNLAKRVEQTPNLIVIIENLAEIINEPMSNDAHYIVNLLGHSWKNEKVVFGNYCIDRSGLTIIITVTPEQKNNLCQELRMDGYYWIEDFDEEFEKIQ